MKQHEQLFLEALKASLDNKKVSWDFEISQETWRGIFELAIAQKVLPLIFEAVYACPAIRGTEFEFFSLVKRRCIENMMVQTRKSAEFLQIYQKLQKEGVNPLVVKGIVCRELYPKPDLRSSADEDLLVDEQDFLKSVKIFESQGFHRTEPERDLKTSDELGFLAFRGSAYIELHRSLFPIDSELWGEMNRIFEEVKENNVEVLVQGVQVRTMEPTMHLLYLICHAFKHFVGSGFGIRQVADMVMFANAYGAQIDWQWLFAQCEELHAEVFTAALFKIGKNYLNFDEKKACYPKEWLEAAPDETDLLLELLQSGIYGGTTMSRKHSSNMTLDAVTAQKKGKKRSHGVAASLFPKAKSLEGKYTYLKKHPYLLPVAWGERLMQYCVETHGKKDNNALDSIKIGNQRIALLKKYGILGE